MNKPPIAKQIPFSYTVGDHVIQDEYFWLRDKAWPNVSDKEVLDYLKSENDYAEKAFFGNFKKEKQKLFDEIKARIKLTDKSEEVQKDEYYYYSRTEEKFDYPIYCRRKGSDGKEEVFLDVNLLAKGKKYTKIGALSVSPDHNMLAYSIDHLGNERYTIQVLDLRTGKYLSENIKDTIGTVVWHQNPSKLGLFYALADENWRATQVFFHPLDSKEPDQLILKEENPLYHFSLGLSSSKKFLLINDGGGQENQVYTIDLSTTLIIPKLFSPMRTKVLYNLEHNKDNFYILTNDISSQFRLVTTNLQDTEDKFWQEYIPADKDGYLESFNITQKYLILNYKKQALPVIKVLDLDSREEKQLNFPDASYTASGYSTNFFIDDMRVSYSSLARPNTIYSYNFQENRLDVIKVTEIPSGFDPNDYKAVLHWTENNGIKVPVSILYKKSLVKFDGLNPLYLYGYGSYGIGMTPAFRSSIISLVDRGFVFAIAHVRGGDELGYEWYESAKFLNKKRTFEDFIAVSEDLITNKYTSKSNIVICGGSAGGLLVGNVINTAPELYKAAIAHVPFVDILNTMLDSSLPLTPGEYKEWGNPAEDDKIFDYIKSYSPYDNVQKKHYPTLFITTSISDPRVGYFEPAKWVAKLRKNKLDDNMLLFKTNLDTGHQGASGRFDYLKEVADDYLFILKIFNINI